MIDAMLEMIINGIFIGLGTAIGVYLAEKKIFKRIDQIEEKVKKYFKFLETDEALKD